MKKQEKIEKPLLPAEDKPIFSDKKNVVRLVLFFAALAIALSSIGYGVYRMGYQEPGPQEIVTDPDADLPYYNAGMSLVYTFTGSSGEIKTRKQEVKEAYTALQKESFRLFDPEHTYPGVVNLASLTKQRGTPLAVSDALFSVLSDAWEKTARGEGYSVLGGAVRAWRESLIYGYEQERRDPAADRETAELLRELSALIRENGVGALAFDREKKTVALTYSAAYTAFLDRLGGDVPALDLDLLSLHFKGLFGTGRRDDGTGRQDRGADIQFGYGREILQLFAVNDLQGLEAGTVIEHDKSDRLGVTVVSDPAAGCDLFAIERGRVREQISDFCQLILVSHNSSIRSFYIKSFIYFLFAHTSAADPDTSAADALYFYSGIRSAAGPAAELIRSFFMKILCCDLSCCLIITD